MQEIKVFENTDFGAVRTVEIDNKTYFIANDVARCLEYATPKDAVTRHCKGALKYRLPTEGGMQDIKIIPEGDVYRLIIKSQLPAAEKFESWVFDEVLPTIRKTGRYGEDSDIIKQTVIEVIKSIMPAVIEAIKTDSTKQEETQAKVYASEYCITNRSKVETFPEDMIYKIDHMLSDMELQQALNFSYVVRFCAANGYSISMPSIKRYYEKRFCGRR